ncbi:DNA glycosylase, partial [Pleomassaria siparia CBS 279.74]
MRTSRISRDTKKISTLAASRSYQRPLRQARTLSNPPIRDFSLNALDARRVARGTGRESELEYIKNNGNNVSGSESELSSVPEDSGDEYTETAAAAAKSRKRKREQSASPVAASVKREIKEISLTAIASPKRKATTTKARRAPAQKQAKTVKTFASAVEKIEPPPQWEEIYALAREMRNEHVAPVDTMGCESLADRNTTPRNQRFQTLVSLMLSSQTKDTVTSVAIKGMQDNMTGGFNLESVLAMEPTTLNAFIAKVGFHNLKTKYIKNTAEILRDKWNSDIPDTIEGLTSLPGVGPKMAYLCMSAAWGRDEGIGVDVHVHRITNLWAWNKTKQPEETRKALQSWLPKDRWHDINNLLVGLGQTICLPVGRKCGECKLASRGLCPSAITNTAIKANKEKMIIKAEDTGGTSL